MKNGRDILSINTHSPVQVPNVRVFNGSIQSDKVSPSENKISITKTEGGFLVSGIEKGLQKPFELYVPDGNVIWAKVAPETNVVELPKKK